MPEKFRAVGWTEDESGCWIWDGRKMLSGYGVLQDCQEKWLSHRASYTIHHGPIPNGMLVCHTCDVPSCVNPSHLFLGTNKDNSDDKIAKGRANMPIGEKASSAKLTDAIVRDIRLSYPAMLGPVLAKKYGIGRSTVYAILSGHTWKHLL